MKLDFNKINKTYLTITLTNGKTYMLTTPTKKLLNNILAMDNLLKANGNVDAMDFDPQTIEDLYSISSEIMSINKTKTIVTSDELGEMWDIEDLILFFNTYMSFIESVANSKN
jgi:hypothetical protein